MNQEPEAPADLEALLADPNMLAPEREAITRLLVATMALEALALPQDAQEQGQT